MASKVTKFITISIGSSEIKLSELDSSRQHFVLNHIVNSQVFITCCNINDVKELESGKVWKVENGTFAEE